MGGGELPAEGLDLGGEARRGWDDRVGPERGVREAGQRPGDVRGSEALSEVAIGTSCAFWRW